MQISTITGTVKWFDTVKGFGFVVPDGGWPEALLPANVVRTAPAKIAYSGARVMCEVGHDYRGLRVTCVIGAAEDGGEPLPYPRGPFIPARIKWFDERRGFGFLRDSAGDIFVHAEVVRGARIWPVAAGDKVRACVERRPGGRFAACLAPDLPLRLHNVVEVAA
jgi:CspA family cold shock protein